MRKRTYLMCRPDHFDVTYVINAWMDMSVPVDRELALTQWDRLRSLYEQLGHTVHVLDGVEGLPDMVFAANGAFSVDGRVYGARFKFPERAREADFHAEWYQHHQWQLTRGEYVNEGEGDFTYVEARQLILAGYGFRTDPLAHIEAQDVLGHPVVSLHLVDSRFYHLDVALFVLDDENICYFPSAFSPGSQRVLEKLFPDAVIATEQDAVAFGLNAVSDGRHVLLPPAAEGLAERLQESGYEPIAVELSEFFKGGGSVKCCTAELRGSRTSS